MKAVIMCGGLGSRLRPLTESIPKPLIKVINRPVLGIIIEKLIETGINDIFISLGYLADEIIEFCDGLDVKAEIKYIKEHKPLGTAGGVRNCIKNSDDDVLVLSGDNIFDINLEGFIRFFNDNNCDAAICGVTVDDPREYGTIVCTEDGRISSFIEKPTWENADSTLVNTGIYLLNSTVTHLIPEDSACDFANDIFPLLLKERKRFFCCKAGGYWGDIGEFSALKGISADILDNKCRINFPKGIFITVDKIINGNSVIKAPSFLGENVKIGRDCTIGPYCIIDNNTSIEDKALIAGSIIGSNVKIGENTQINDSVLADSVVFEDNCISEDGCVYGYGVVLGRFTRVLPGNKIRSGVRICEESLVSKDTSFDLSSSMEFDATGMTGQVFSEFSLDDALMLGKSVASVSEIKRVGIATDGEIISENYKSCTLAGLSVCGKDCYDYGVIFKSQAYFYSAYSSLDFFIFISYNENKINYSCFGRQGLPVSVSTARKINNNRKFSVFDFCEPDKCEDVIPAHYLSAIYFDFIRKVLGKNISGIKISFEGDNALLIKAAEGAFDDYLAQNVFSEKKTINFLLKANVSDMYISYVNKTYSGERVISLMSELELAAGNNILIPEDFPSFIEEVAEKYTGSVRRVNDNNRDALVLTDREVLTNLWTVDCLMLTAKLISYLQMSEVTLDELFKNQKYFAMRKAVVNVDRQASEIGEILKRFAIKNKNDIYYLFENRKGRVRLRQMGNSAKIRILAESYDIESAKEISDFIVKKINECNIDNE